MNEELLLEQTKVESQVLEHVTRALESALGWVVLGKDFSRKLSSVRFGTELYQRHLERLFALEEIDACAKLRQTINQVLEHLRRESELLFVSVQRDIGGEG
jgi:hypothetical protein